jgi:predicted transcriptional regulator of viral defense system
MEEHTETVRHWIETLPKRGRLTFSKEDLERQFPTTPMRNIRNVLFRLTQKKKVQSVWHGFYTTIPDKYGLKGIVPPIDYIDSLMNRLHRPYYIGVISAAAFQGAGHQQPQEFSVVISGAPLRTKLKGDVKINFICRKVFPEQFVNTLETRTGKANISSPELTAFDVLQYERHCGGLNRVATMLVELTECLDFTSLSKDFLALFNCAVIQRMGYLLDTVLERQDLADALYKHCINFGIEFRKRALFTRHKNFDSASVTTNDKWKIVVNGEVEPDIW